MDKLGRYEILGEIASGGMAEILLGRVVGPSGFERLVVIKRILPHLAKRAEFVAMFLDEARTVARLRHPNVVQVHELGKEGGELFLVMEYLEGESVASLLRRVVSRGERVEPVLAMHIVAEACRGLHAAHEATDDGMPLDLVHRDVSPQNLFVTYAGEVKVLDFGIAKVADRTTRTEAGQVKGKFAYMSPEQCVGKALDRRTDVFALGTVLWELCTGRQLFKRGHELATMKAICELPIPPASSLEAKCTTALDEVLSRALERNRDRRTPTAADLRREILAVARGMSDADLGEELAATMRRAFADRIAAKAEMLQRARTASSVSIPGAEPDPEVEMPTADAALEPTGTMLLHAPAATPIASRTKSLVAVGAVAALVLGGWGALRLRTPAADSPRATQGAAPAPSASGAAVPKPTSTTPTAAASRGSDVVVHVASTPAGARVTIDAHDVGTTPTDVHLTRGAAPQELVVTRPGFKPFRQAVTPDVDQRIFTTLEASPRATPAHGDGERIEKLP